METYAIVTDSETWVGQADTLTDALHKAGMPANVTDEDSFVEHLRKTEGYGHIEEGEYWLCSYPFEQSARYD